MLIHAIEITAFRSIEYARLAPLANINVLTGANNSGKSTVLQALYAFQTGNSVKPQDIRVGSSEATVNVEFPDAQKIPWLAAEYGAAGTGSMIIHLQSPNRTNLSASFGCTAGNTNYAIAHSPNTEPNYFCIPYLSKRKASTYTEDVRLLHAQSIQPNFTFLPAKLSRVASPGFPSHEAYRRKCIEILGFFVATIPSQSGQHVGVYLPDGSTISIESMGEGIPNIVALIADLVSAKNRIFLIEEPENDLHPRALKALLDLIIEKSGDNQFFVSTHSNIVVRHLAGAPNSQLFKVNAKFGELPTTSTFEEIPPTAEARLEVLRDLGYSFSDFDLWDGWLILEESSAERIIRDYLIPWFAPRLSRVRTLSTSGVDKVEPVFEDFNRLVRFTHLEEAYRNSTWVVVDGDDPGKAVIERLQSSYSGWDKNRFRTLNQPRFEDYYPSNFKEAVEAAFAKTERKERMAAKKELLNSVLSWTKEDMARAKAAFSKSAGEIIDILQEIEVSLP